MDRANYACCLPADLPCLRMDHASVAHGREGSDAGSDFRMREVPRGTDRDANGQQIFESAFPLR
jgi:hypothetical protein